MCDPARLGLTGNISGSWTYLLIKRILEEILFNPKMDHIPPIPEVPLEGGDMLGFGRGRGYKWREMSRDLGEAKCLRFHIGGGAGILMVRCRGLNHGL